MLTFPLSSGVEHFDIMPDKIHQQVNIHYLMKDDAEKEVTVVEAFVVFHEGVED
ncbi:hypothetical protein N7G274_002704 [Stereocaulon virgatum]|uniref:Uncharacterized protein n=1 Tax=Stereocaulon virgatum TaxID=373712 RepID=A0ABR4AJQ7_9LECA